MTRPPAILLMGPTGAGKTDLAAELVARLPLEIVSVDAAMVYRGMDIGTAKPSPEVLARAPHHLIDLIDQGGRSRLHGLHSQRKIRAVGSDLGDRRQVILED